MLRRQRANPKTRAGRFGPTSLNEYYPVAIRNRLLVHNVTIVKRKRRMSDKKNNIQPLQDRIIVQRLENEEKTASGLYIPDSAKEKPQQGKVLAVGKGKILEDGSARPVDVKVGDTVIFGKYSGQEIKVDGEDLLIMKEDDVYGVLEN
jgi:chaperonin GroES